MCNSRIYAHIWVDSFQVFQQSFEMAIFTTGAITIRPTRSMALFVLPKRVPYCRIPINNGSRSFAIIMRSLGECQSFHQCPLAISKVLCIAAVYSSIMDRGPGLLAI